MTAFDRCYRGKRVLVTGETGFKGSWLTWWLRRLGAEVIGLALPPTDERQLYLQARLGDVTSHQTIDLRNGDSVVEFISKCGADIVFHLAAQALVRQSYELPVETFATNILGTVHVLEGVRQAKKSCAVVIVTSDKCYDNQEWSFGYRENDPMGGYDPYSASKGCAELVTAAYRRSFFPVSQIGKHEVRVASARAGNVFGPGDWAMDRILPDAIGSLLEIRPIKVRNPRAVRPWQHVLEPLSGYLLLGERLISDDTGEYAEAWNFGPSPESCCPVKDLIELVIETWGSGEWEDCSNPQAAHEAGLLRLAIDKSISRLNWTPVWDFRTAVARTVRGYRALASNACDFTATRLLMDQEIDAYTESACQLKLSWTN